jgi:hypothetical protein
MKKKITLSIIAIIVLYFIVKGVSIYLEIKEFEEGLKSKEVVSYTLKSNTKEIHFIGMTHIGQKEFYENIKKEVIKFKKKGYVLFYEFIDTEDKSVTEIDLRKVRKFAGFLPTENGHKQGIRDFSNIKGLEAQRNEMFFNLINNKDYIADISVTLAVKAYEDRYGEIILTPEDLNTPLEETVSETLPTKDMFSIVLDFRNIHIANFITESEYDKIILMYGSEHKTGVLEELKKIDNSWQEIN